MPSSPNRTCGSRNQNALAALIPKSLNDEKLPMRHVTYERIGLTWITLYITTLAYQNDDLYNCHHSIVLEHSTSMTYLIVFGMRRTDECLYKLSSSSRFLEGDSSKTDATSVEFDCLCKHCFNVTPAHQERSCPDDNSADGNAENTSAIDAAPERSLSCFRLNTTLH